MILESVRPDPDLQAIPRSSSPKESQMRRVHFMLVLLPLLAACGSDSVTNPDGFRQEMTGTVSVFGTTEHLLSVSRSGNMTVTLRWTDASIDLDLYLTGSNCTGYPPADCSLLAVSDAVGTIQESIQRTVASGEQFKIWVDNFSESSPSNYTLTVTID